MDWSFEGPNGAVTVRREGEKAVCQAIRAADSGGLYKAWLRGAGGRILLGTLIPDGGALRLRRVMDIPALERQGAWPPEGAEILMAYAFTKEAPSTAPDRADAVRLPPRSEASPFKTGCGGILFGLSLAPTPALSHSASFLSCQSRAAIRQLVYPVSIFPSGDPGAFA